jgi:hypothetical protein
LPKITQILSPLTDLLKGKDLPMDLSWEEQHDTTFDAAKAALASAMPLPHPRSGMPMALATDTSDTHVGGVLQQQVRGHWQPLGFFFFNSVCRRLKQTTPPSTGSCLQPSNQLTIFFPR